MIYMNIRYEMSADLFIYEDFGWVVGDSMAIGYIIWA